MGNTVKKFSMADLVVYRAPLFVLKKLGASHEDDPQLNNHHTGEDQTSQKHRIL